MTVCLPTQDGTPFVQWINYITGDCVYGTQAAVSLLLGYASILFWLNAQLPQLIENYKQGSAEGLSLKFLTIWLAGDSANLIGSILTHQLPFQLYLGVYFVSIDICLLCQYYYYNSYKQPRHHDEYVIIQPEVQQERNKLKDKDSTLFQHPAEIPIAHKQVIIDELTPFSSSASPSKWYTLIDNNNKDHKVQKFMSVFLFTTFYLTNPTSTTLTTTTTTTSEMILFSDDQIIWLGRFFAWTCTSLYLMSRVPQLLKNRRRQSVDGLSPSLFIFAVCGNLTYACSILSNPDQTVESLLEALPYLIGSAGTLIFDFSIFCQFLYYKNHTKIPDNKDLV